MDNKRGHILIVDDQSNWLKALGSLLLKDGHTVVTAMNFEEAKSKLLQEKFDVVTLDVRLMDDEDFNVQGLELLREIRRQNLNSRVVLLTGYPEIIQQPTIDEYKPDQILYKVPQGSMFDNNRFREIILSLI